MRCAAGIADHRRIASGAGDMSAAIISATRYRGVIIANEKIASDIYQENLARYLPYRLIAHG